MADSSTAVSNRYNLRWPENLDDIKVTTQEKELLQKKIESLIETLPKPIPTETPYAAHISNPSCPRRLFIDHDHYFVVLNTRGGMPKFSASGTQQSNIKYVWDCKSGSFWLKKKCISSKQIDGIDYLVFGKAIGQSSFGIPHIVVDHPSKINKQKLCYFEQMTPYSLTEWMKKFGFENEYDLDWKYVYGLMDALRKIHAVRYHPPSFQNLYSNELYDFDLSHTLFHGDISPNHIICEKTEENAEGKICPRLMLSDFYDLGNINHILWTPGWGSPECIQFAENRSKYQRMNVSRFMAMYGAKKDSWALGLIIGSLLQNGWHSSLNQQLPYFSFITKRLKFDSDGQRVVDESSLADLTQEEIDLQIDTLIAASPPGIRRLLWQCVKAYLIVDPDKRPTLANCFISLPDDN